MFDKTAGGYINGMAKANASKILFGMKGGEGVGQGWSVTDDMVSFISFNDFEDQNPDHYGLSGSATQVERIFPPEKNSEKSTISGDASQQAEGLFELIKGRKII